MRGLSDAKVKNVLGVMTRMVKTTTGQAGQYSAVIDDSNQQFTGKDDESDYDGLDFSEINVLTLFKEFSLAWMSLLALATSNPL